MKHELLRGEHIVLPPPNVRRSRARHKLLEFSVPLDVHIATGFKLSFDTWLQPHISLIRTAQIRAADPDGYLERAPGAAIEVASDSNTAAPVDLKTGLYFAHASKEVWVAYPKTEKVCVHFPDGRSQTFAGSELRSELFPGWSIPDSLFQD